MRSNARENFKIINAGYVARGKANVRLTQSSLFLTKDIDPTKSSYIFDVLETQNSTLLPDEIRLNINDEFTCTDMALYLYGEQNTNGRNTAKGTQLLTYAPIELNGDALSLAPLYKGTFKAAVNNIVYLEKWDIRKHLIIPRTELAGFVTGTNIGTQPALDYATDAMIEMAPMLTLSGAKKNELSINLPDAMSPVNLQFLDQQGNAVNWNITRIALRLFGLNAQNAALFQ